MFFIWHPFVTFFWKLFYQSRFLSKFVYFYSWPIQRNAFATRASKYSASKQGKQLRVAVSAAAAARQINAFNTCWPASDGRRQQNSRAGINRYAEKPRRLRRHFGGEHSNAQRHQRCKISPFNLIDIQLNICCLSNHVIIFNISSCGIFKKQAVLTLSQWMPQPKDQNDNVNLLVNKMKDSLQTSQPDDAVKAMAIQVNISPCLN